MTKKIKAPVLVTPRGTALRCYVDQPDTVAPEGVTWKPNGNYKVTVVIDPDDAGIEALEAKVKAFAAQACPKIPFDKLTLPIVVNDADAHESVAGKVTIRCESKFRPEVRDAKLNIIDTKKITKKSGEQIEVLTVPVRSGDVVKAAFTPNYYSKEDVVLDGGKKKKITTHGINFRLAAVQLIEKRAGSGYADAFSEEEGFSVEADAGGNQSSGGGFENAGDPSDTDASDF